ncbi:MAG TPA: DEAD/DEAH box helicase [Candidatus Saccharimonadales bacterium]
MPSYNARHFGAGRPVGRGFERRRPSSRSNSKNKGNRQFIDPNKFIQAAKPVTEDVFTPEHAFSDFAMNPLLHRNIAAKGFTAPSRIQDAAIPHGLTGRDVVGIANTGTGKTTAFALPVLHKLMQEPNSRALIIAPTRELAEQIEAEVRSLAKGSGLFGALLIGGMPMPRQLRELSARPGIIIGTPGRIKDHFERGTLRLADVNVIVLDEVDRMVDMGFINDIRFLLGELNPERQSLFFSATMDPNVEGLVQGFLHEPVMISVRTSATSENVEQNVVRYFDNVHKMDQLHDVLNRSDVSKALIFDETQRNVEKLAQELLERGFRTDALHGGKSQSQRTSALKRFKNGDVNVLVATDVAARGIDVADITHVINYSLPNNYDDYTHRIGRAGRAGRQGYALTFIKG